ncbi:hypothetical protein Tco_1456694 [Tanacetum coccineum]
MGIRIATVDKWPCGGGFRIVKGLEYCGEVNEVDRDRQKRWRNCMKEKLLTVPAAQVPGYNDNAYEELVAAMETMKLLELPHIGSNWGFLSLPVRVTSLILLHLRRRFHEESLEAHAIKLAKKQWVKGKGNIKRCLCMERNYPPF